MKRGTRGSLWMANRTLVSWRPAVREALNRGCSHPAPPVPAPALGPCHGAAGPQRGPQLSVRDSRAPGCVHTFPALALEAPNLPMTLMLQPLREGEGLLEPHLGVLCPFPVALHHCLPGQRSAWWQVGWLRPGPQGLGSLAGHAFSYALCWAPPLPFSSYFRALSHRRAGRRCPHRYPEFTRVRPCLFAGFPNLLSPNRASKSHCKFKCMPI